MADPAPIRTIIVFEEGELQAALAGITRLPEPRRKLTDRQILDSVLANWWRAEPGFQPSVHDTAAFLWCIVISLVVGLGLLGIAAGWRAIEIEQHCGHVAGAGAHVEQVQRTEPEAPPRREENHVAHGPQIACGNGGGA